MARVTSFYFLVFCHYPSAIASVLSLTFHCYKSIQLVDLWFL